MINSFAFAKTPIIYFGAGKFAILPQIISTYGSTVLVVTGFSSFISTSYWAKLQQSFNDKGMTWHHTIIDREPSPQMIDHCTEKYRNAKIDAVVAIGGGSVLDAGKAISAMLHLEDSVKFYLEGVGTKEHDGRKIPFIAIPTTSGTGSEATKNAVISEVGDKGFKRSLRHNNFVPDQAIIDPELTLNCTPDITAKSGMDAFTQLLESYVSTVATPITDSLALNGLAYIKNSLLQAFKDGSDINARSGMSYAALISGITLANAGLGVVHGFASSLGGYLDIPHGTICGTLMGASNRITVERLINSSSASWALDKYAEAGKLFSNDDSKSKTYYISYFLDLIDSYTDELQLPKLSKYGLSKKDFSAIIATTDSKNNPIKLNSEDLERILNARL